MRGKILRLCGIFAAARLIHGACPPARAQHIVDTEPRAPRIEQEMETEAQDNLFLLNHIPLLPYTDNAMNRLDELSPITFGAQGNFLSNWLDEGMNAAKHGVQITQTYSAEYAREISGFSGGAGFEFFQVDTTRPEGGPRTLEQDFTIYLPLSWKRLSVRPCWTYVRIDDFYGDDSGEIGAQVSVDMPLNPAFSWNYDYDDAKGNYFEWSISHPFPICIRGEKLAVFTPSMAMGMNAYKGIEKTALTHIDWGLDLAFPINHHFTVAGLLHFTKSLSRLKTEDGRVFEDIVPWAGLSLTAGF